MKPNDSDVLLYDLLTTACLQEAAISDLTLEFAVINAALYEIFGQSFADATLRIRPLLKESEAYQRALDRQIKLNEYLEQLKKRLNL